MGKQGGSHGKRLPFTNISVDLWSFQPSVRHFFLTHMHADHTEGLHHGWDYGTVYCSEISKRLLLHKFDINPERIITIEAGQTIEIIMSVDIPPTSPDAVRAKVTAIDANHCPGALMYFFEGYFGKVLFTGDFRYRPSMLTDQAVSGQVDSLYLDTTYCHPKYVFPAKEESEQMVLVLVRELLQEDSNVIILIGLDHLGKEELLVHIAQQLNVKIHVSPQRMETIKLIGNLPEHVFTTNQDETRLRVVFKREASLEKLTEMNNTQRTVLIVPTGWACDPDSWLGQNSRSEPLSQAPTNSQSQAETQAASGAHSLIRTASAGGQKLIYYVPYSIHSNYWELIEFVSSLRPRSLHPLTLSKSFDIHTHLSSYLHPDPPEPFNVPASIYSLNFPRLSPDEQQRRLQDLLLGQGSATERTTTTNSSGRRPFVPPNKIVGPDSDADDDSQGEEDVVLLSAVQGAPSITTTQTQTWQQRASSLIEQFYGESAVVPEDFHPALQADQLSTWSEKMKMLMETSNSSKKVLLSQFTKAKLKELKENKLTETRIHGGMEGRDVEEEEAPLQSKAERKRGFSTDELSQSMREYQHRKWKKRNDKYITSIAVQYFQLREGDKQRSSNDEAEEEDKEERKDHSYTFHLLAMQD